MKVIFVSAVSPASTISTSSVGASEVVAATMLIVPISPFQDSSLYAMLHVIGMLSPASIPARRSLSPSRRSQLFPLTRKVNSASCGAPMLMSLIARYAFCGSSVSSMNADTVGETVILEEYSALTPFLLAVTATGMSDPISLAVYVFPSISAPATFHVNSVPAGNSPVIENVSCSSYEADASGVTEIVTESRLGIVTDEFTVNSTDSLQMTLVFETNSVRRNLLPASAVPSSS